LGKRDNKIRMAVYHIKRREKGNWKRYEKGKSIKDTRQKWLAANFRESGEVP